MGLLFVLVALVAFFSIVTSGYNAIVIANKQTQGIVLNHAILASVSSSTGELSTLTTLSFVSLYRFSSVTTASDGSLFVTSEEFAGASPQHWRLSKTSLQTWKKDALPVISKCGAYDLGDQGLKLPPPISWGGRHFLLPTQGGGNQSLWLIDTGADSATLLTQPLPFIVGSNGAANLLWSLNKDNAVVTQTIKGGVLRSVGAVVAPQYPKDGASWSVVSIFPLLGSSENATGVILSRYNATQNQVMWICGNMNMRSGAVSIINALGTNVSIPTSLVVDPHDLSLLVGMGTTVIVVLDRVHCIIKAQTAVRRDKYMWSFLSNNAAVL